MKEKIKVLIAGIGGASLGTELAKCLTLTQRYVVYGCDISPLAYGHYAEDFHSTFLIERSGYVESVIDLCTREKIACVVPGGEEPMVLLGMARNTLENNGIHLAGNSLNVIKICSDKAKTFQYLSEFGIRVPYTLMISTTDELVDILFPCIIKPAGSSGGSSFVFLAGNKDEAFAYTKYILDNSLTPIVQEYIPLTEGEFTVGVLSLPDGHLLGSIALKRLFNAKLSVLMKSEVGLISSGYSQGLIDNFPEVRATAEKIAEVLQSAGPINVQGRIKNGLFIPFEINPRFSASAYLRALAGFNELDIYLRYLATGIYRPPVSLRYGYYLRSLSETFVEMKGLQQ